MRSKIGNEKGSALMLTSILITILFLLGASLITLSARLSVSLSRMRHRSMAFYAADSGIQISLYHFRLLLSDIGNSIANATYSQIQELVSQNKPLKILEWGGLTVGNSDSIRLTLNISSPQCRGFTISQTPVSNDISPDESFAISMEISSNGSITSSSNPELYVFPLRCRIKSTGTRTVSGRKISEKHVLVEKIFSIFVSRETFARYALFTDAHTLPDGTTVWFTNMTNFNGPVHTNGRFAFAGNPGPTFTREVTSVSSTARYYNNGNPVNLNADSNPPRDTPTFQEGFRRGVNPIPLPPNLYDQKNIALGGSSPPTSNGIYLQISGNRITRGGIFVKGDASIVMSIVGGKQVYTITQGSTTKEITIDLGNNTTTIKEGGSTSTYTGVPVGMIYVDGKITSIGGYAASTTQVSIVARGDLMITDHIRLEVDPREDPKAQNVIGLLSETGNVRITTSAPNDIVIQATVMAPNGVFTVDNYSSGSPRGIAHILGGVISKWYGAFGMFSGTPPQHRTGYGRDFVYDERMAGGFSPPFFPITTRYLCTTKRPTGEDTFAPGIWREI